MSVQSRTSDVQNFGKLPEAESKEVCQEICNNYLLHPRFWIDSVDG